MFRVSEHLLRRLELRVSDTFMSLGARVSQQQFRAQPLVTVLKMPPATDNNKELGVVRKEVVARKTCVFFLTCQSVSGLLRLSLALVFFVVPDSFAVDLKFAVVSVLMTSHTLQE